MLRAVNWAYRCERSEVEKGAGKNDREDKHGGPSTESGQLDGELETTRDRIRQYGLEEIFETKSKAENNGDLADKNRRHARCIENLLTPV